MQGQAHSQRQAAHHPTGWGKRDTSTVVVWTWRTFLALAGAALLALLGAAPARATVALFPVSITESIIWQTPSFGPSTFTGNSIFETGQFNGDNHFFSDGSFGSVAVPPAPIQPPSPIFILLPPAPIIPGDAIIWQFGGNVTVTGDGSVFPTVAFPPAPIIPPGPPVTPPSITIGLDFLPGFTAFDITGPIIAWDAPVQIGTWDIHVAPVPEPASLLLFSTGLGALALFRRRKVRNSA